MPYYAIDVSVRITEKVSILFKKSISLPSLIGCSVACLALTDSYRIRLLDFPFSVGSAMKEVIHQNYPFGAINHKPADGNIELDLHECPWMVNRGGTKGGAQYHARAMLGRMMMVAEQHGWHVSISGDVSAKTEKKKRREARSADVHSIYFIKM